MRVFGVFGWARDAGGEPRRERRAMRASDGRWSTPIASIPNVFIGSRVRWRGVDSAREARRLSMTPGPSARAQPRALGDDDRSARRLGAARDVKPCLNEMD